VSEVRSALEEKVVATVRDARDELIGLTAELVACDTTARTVGMPARDEEKLQRILERRLLALGAETDLWEPEPTGTGNRHVPDDLDFRGRPQLAAHLRGAGGGRSLLLNGHIDAVDVEPREKWTDEPFKLARRDGRLYARGVGDMKGGVAALVVALEALARAGIRLAGDVVFCTNTDEESSGAGGFACVARGVKAAAGICAEPTGFDAWVACRGTLTPFVTVEGRPGHAEVRQPHWREGGAVNAIEKAVPIIQAAQRLRDEWRARPDQQHPLLSPGDIVPTIISGGTWEVTYPASCTICFDSTYLPGQLDEEGTGKAVEAEIRRAFEAAAATDPWFDEHPPAFKWQSDVVPAEMPADHPLVVATLEAGAGLGKPGKPGGLDSWHDAATYTLRGGTPTFSYGADGIATAHTIDEWIVEDDLVDAAAVYALAAMRWCGVVA
jgi:acetylornithine deacetylase